MIRWLQSSLRAKLLLAFLLVIAVGTLTSLLVISLVAPRLFEEHMVQMMGPSDMSGAMSGGADAATSSLEVAFQSSVTQAVLVATAAATLVALAASLFISERITGRVRRIASSTRHIAAGHYSERVVFKHSEGADELGQLTHSFNEMAHSLEATEARRVELLGDVAHELRTPINTLAGYLDGLLDGIVQPSQETWASLRDETGRLNRLADDLRDLSRAEARQFSLNPVPEDPSAIARAALDRLRSDFAEEGLELVEDVATNLPPVMADRDRTVQVLTNLLTNALRYTPPPGKVTLSVSRAPGSPGLGGGSGDEVLFQVVDTGIGVSPEDLPHLFDRFYRVEKWRRSRAAGGSGIGLTIARAIVEAQGGRIWAESPGPGLGSTFSFTLPTVRRV
ncbi:MAG: HAMP domain-containing protein [Chloroflexi bacterium]|nr:HAMP domain-containing protein [Chloroflexota bacterium]